MKFTKMQGAGNDYVYVDCFAESIPPNEVSAVARSIADRNFGVGGDGLILIAPHPDADAEMKMYNADGSYSEMCGNGIRCVAKYVYDHGIAKKNPLTIVSADAHYSLQLDLLNDKVQEVTVDMGEPILTPSLVPTTLRSKAGEDAPAIDVPLAIGERQLHASAISMGNPHCVVFVDKLDDDWVLNIGPQLETSKEFPQRVNVEFVQVISPHEVRQRTWERGSGETLACGTGASAVCVAGVLSGRTDREIIVHLPGGDLFLRWDQESNRVMMRGPATEVFQGEWHHAPQPC